MKKQLNSLNYRQAQQRNTVAFKELSKSQQKQLRQQGYNNRGWDNIVNSWTLIELLEKAIAQLNNLVSLDDFKHGKMEAKFNRAMLTGDVTDAMEAFRVMNEYYGEFKPVTLFDEEKELSYV